MVSCDGSNSTLLNSITFASLLKWFQLVLATVILFSENFVMPSVIIIDT
jgi:hypothetical protein